jgi:hypothetical protein
LIFIEAEISSVSTSSTSALNSPSFILPGSLWHRHETLKLLQPDSRRNQQQQEFKISFFISANLPASTAESSHENFPWE